MKKLLKLFKRGPHYIKAVKRLTKNDVILVSFPKSGNTWIRNIIANYLGQKEMGKDIITFKELDDIMPSFGNEIFFKEWNFKIPKFSATHLQFFPFFKKCRNVLVIRDPRDVMVSYFHYINRKKGEYMFPTLFDLLIHPKLGLEAWFKHTISWSGKIDFLIVYEEVLEDDISVINNLFTVLRVEYDSEVLEKAVENSRFDTFKMIEETYGHSKPENNKEGFHFARKGKSGDYKNHFDDKCYALYTDILKKYGFEDYEVIIKKLRGNLKK